MYLLLEDIKVGMFLKFKYRSEIYFVATISKGIEDEDAREAIREYLVVIAFDILYRPVRFPWKNITPMPNSQAFCVVIIEPRNKGPWCSLSSTSCNASFAHQI